MGKRKSPLERFMSKVSMQDDGCWHWTGYIGPGGYGSFRLSREEGNAKAHRAGYEMLVGGIPSEMQLDHLCRVRHCVNPAHLEPVAPQVNTDRGLSRKRLYCKSGRHLMSPENTGGRSDGRRYCMACHRERQEVRNEMLRQRKLATHE